MAEDLVTFYQMPSLHAPILIVGFGGWSNAGNVAVKTIDHLVREKRATLLAEIDPDPFYQFTQNRPAITVKEGRLHEISLQRPSFYFWPNREGEHDLILLKSQEPDCRWLSFVNTLFHLCRQWAVSHIINIGGLYDDVLHTEAIVSGVYSLGEWRDVFSKHNISLIEYEGPSGIHSIIMQRAEKEGYPLVGLWGHSPLYLRGTNFRVVIRVLELIGSIFGFPVETSELERALGGLDHQIEEILKDNTELTDHIEKIKRLRSVEPRKTDTPKVINIKDFIRPKDTQ